MSNPSGFSERRLVKLREAMEGFVARDDVPGIVYLVCRRGELRVQALGRMSRDNQAPMARNTIFRIASMTKPLVAVAAMILVEECRLRLDDPVDELLPELADRQVLRSIDTEIDDTVPANRPIALRDLLTFTFGAGMIMARPGTYPIQEAVRAAGMSPGPPKPSTFPDPDEYMRRLGSLPLLYQPGERWLYHTGSDVLGVLIARAAGQPLADFMDERIFRPLGMRDTGFYVPPEKVDRFATAYWKDFQTGEPTVFDPAAGSDWGSPPIFPAGGSGLVSTVDDLLSFSRMLLQGGVHGAARILSRPAVEAMTTDQLTPAQKSGGELIPGYWDSHGWGLGMAVVTKKTGPAGSLGAYGWDGGFGTSWSNDPKEHLIGILLTQQLWTSPTPPPVCRDFWTLAYGAIDD